MVDSIRSTSLAWTSIVGPARTMGVARSASAFSDGPLRRTNWRFTRPTDTIGLGGTERGRAVPGRSVPTSAGSSSLPSAGSGRIPTLPEMSPGTATARGKTGCSAVRAGVSGRARSSGVLFCLTQAIDAIAAPVSKRAAFTVTRWTGPDKESATGWDRPNPSTGGLVDCAAAIGIDHHGDDRARREPRIRTAADSAATIPGTCSLIAARTPVTFSSDSGGPSACSARNAQSSSAAAARSPAPASLSATAPVIVAVSPRSRAIAVVR